MMSGGWDEFVKRNQQPGEQERAQGNDWAGFITRNQNGGMQQTGAAARVSQRKQPRTGTVAGLSLPEIGTDIQVEKGLVDTAWRELGGSLQKDTPTTGSFEPARVDKSVPLSPTGKRSTPLTAAQAEQAYARVGELETELGNLGTGLDEAWNYMQQQETRITQMEQRLQALYTEFEKNPTQQGADMYNQAYHQYQRAWAEYMNGYRRYETAYQGYEGARKQYEEQLGVYNDYVSLFTKEDGSYDYEALARAAQEEYDAYTGTEKYRQEQAAAFTPGSTYLTGGTGQASGQGSTYLTGTVAPEKETTRAEELKILADYYRQMADRQQDDALMAADMEEFESWSQEDKTALETYVMNRSNEIYTGTSGQARADAAALFEKYGAKRVNEIAESYERYHNKRNADTFKGMTQISTGRNGWTAAGHSAASVAANTWGGLPALIGGMQSAANGTGRYKTLDPYHVGNLPQLYAGTVRGTVAQKIQGEDGDVGRWALSQGYQGLMSALDNVARMYASGGMLNRGGVTQIGNLRVGTEKLLNHGLSALNSYTSTLQQASAEGATPLQANVMALGGAAIEVLTEEISLDRLLKSAESAPGSIKEILKRTLTQGGIEASEEELSFLLNLGLEAAVLRGETGYRMRIGELMDSGSSYEEAKETADRELLTEVVNTAVSAFLSGGMMEGAQSTVGYIQDAPNRQAAEQLQTAPGAAVDNGRTAAQPLEAGSRVTIPEGIQVNQAAVQTADRLSRALGRDVVFYQAANEQENGYYNAGDGKIYIASTSENPTAQIVGHELTHSIEQAGAYRDLADIVMRHYEAAGLDLDAMRQKIRERYAAGGHELATQDDVDRELVAEYVEQYLLTDEKSIQEVCRQNRSLGQKIRDWITKLLAKLGSDRAKGDEFLIRARDAYTRALAETRGSFTEQTAPAAAKPAQNTRQAQSQANTGDAAIDAQIRLFEEQHARGELTDSELRESVAWARAEAARKAAAPEPDESWMDGLSLPTVGDGGAAPVTGEETDPWDEDAFEALLEDEEVAGTAPRYSYGGINARGADMEALQQAKVMASQGVAYETIRQETGWFRGSDGKWRFEIDDREMTYDRQGNARGAADRRAAEEDLKIVRNDLFRDMPWEDRPKVLDWARAEHNGNRAEAQAIYEELGAEYGVEFYEYTRAIRRVWETSDAPRGGFLPDYISHPTLFDHYPELTRVAVRFEPMYDGTRAQYRRDSNTIVLNDRLQDGEEETIIHEIQHAIQQIEGFARGSNPEFWKEFQQGATPIRTNDGKVERLEAKIEEILSGLPENIAAQFQRFDELEKTHSQDAYAIAEELGEGPWAKQFSDYFMAAWDLELAQQYNRPRSANDLYRNTAGEIEARDAAARRTMTPEERKNTPPDLGGEETVFMEGAAAMMATLDAEYGYQMQSFVEPEFTPDEIEGNIQKAAQMATVAQITGQEFAKGEKDLTTQVDEFFAQLGNTAFNPQLGDVILDRRGIKSDIAHGIGRKKAASFAAVPDVIEKGLVVDYQNNWKNRGYDTAVLAAPISIGGENHIAAVILTRSNETNRFYVHEVLTTKDGAMPFKTGTQGKGDSGGDAPSVFSILNRIRNVKQYSVGSGDQSGKELLTSQDTKALISGALKHFGRTFSWRETGYLLTGGEKLDFSGRHEGASGGYRTVDHRDILDIYPEDSDLSGNEAMVDFMARGNIRIMPESGGINLQTLPTKAQERGLDDFISRNRGEVILDIDNARGDTVASVEYPRGTRAERVLRDIRQYFQDGTVPYISDVQRFRYSVSPEDSEGRMLTPEQKRFFRNSKVRDAQGRLQAVYHGTQSMGFTVFDPAKSDDLISLFFSAKKQTARTYSDSYDREQDTYAIDRDTDLSQFGGEPDEGQIRTALREAGYEPTSDGLITDRAEAEAFAEDVRKAYRATADREGAPMESVFKKQMAMELTDSALSGADGWYRVSAGYLGEELLIDRESAEQIARWSAGANKGLYEVYLNLTNPFILDCKGREWNDIGYGKLKGEGVPQYEGYKTRDVTAWAKANGYDGVIFKNIFDLGSHAGQAGEMVSADTVYVAFSSEQVKSTANKTPTTNPDIRYSVGSREPEGLSLPTAEGEEDVKSLTPYRDQLPAKARDYLGRAESKLLRGLQSAMSVPGGTKRMILKPLVQQISEEYLREGRITDQRIDELFEEAWTRGIIVDTAYYDQYKEIKDYIRTTGVTLKRRDQADIADFGDFKKRAFGTIRIVNDGLPVDTAYGELHTMAPNLFPESITHPADQLVRMFEVAQGIRKSEQTLQEYYGAESEAVKRGTRYEFDSAIGEILGELRTVKEYADAKAAEDEKEAEAPMTPQEAMEVYGQLKEARRVYERANARNLLKPEDQLTVGRLLEGRISLEDLDPSKENVRGITEVYEAKAEYERLIAQIRRYKQGLRGAMRKKADSYLQTALQWKDKAVGIAYSRETMERNIRDIVPDRALAKQIIREYFTPVHKAEAASNRFRNEYRDRVRGMDLSRKVKKGNVVSEAHAVQLLGEAMDNIAYLQKLNRRNAKRDGKSLAEWQAVVADLWEQNPGLDRGKIEGAVKQFRQIYDELFQKMNEVRVANGYEPVNYRQGYFPHFQPGDGDGIMAAFGRAMGIDTQVAALPTTINGLTHTFKPGITWFGNAQERLGFNTAYDAVEGFDKYIEGVASVIHHTENIQKLRALATQIRYNASDEGIKKQVDAIIARTELTEEEKQALINDLYGKARYNLSNFVTELEEYTNLLANKKSKLDRTTEALIGRRCYTIMKAWENRVGANMIAGNITSAMTNLIPITQAAARVGHQNMLKGMWDSLKELKTGGDILGESAFLTNRRGSDPLVRTWVDKASNVAGLPMELIDNFTSGAVLRAAYYHNLKQGLSEAEAMEQADNFAAGVMADRSKGAMPTLFESTNPLFKLFTQFQLEVNNQWSEVLKDLPAEAQEAHPESKFKQAAALTGVLLQYFLGALLYNEAYEYFVGRRPAMDPIGILNDTVGDLTGYEMPNLVQWGLDTISGEETDFETEKVHFGDAMANLAANVAGELPFSSALTLMGVELDNGRVPAASAIPDLTVLKDVLFNPDWSDAKRLKEAEDELWKLSYILPPFGGNQLQKIWKGLKVYFEGGSYTVNSAGEEMLQYPVFRDDDGMDWMTAVQSAMLGKSSLEEAQAWVTNGFDTLGVKQTAVYRDLIDAGVDDREAWQLLKDMSSVTETEADSKKDLQREVLSESEISEEGKAIVYYGLMASESEREFMDAMADAGTQPDRLYGLMLQWNRTEGLKGDEKSLSQYDLVAGFAGTDQEKEILAREILGDELLTEKGKPTAYADYLNATGAGLDPNDFFLMRYKGVDMDDYFELTDQGVLPDDARDLLLNMEKLQPLEGEEEVLAVQRWRTCVDFSGDEAVQLAAMKGETTDAQYLKFELATQMGVSLDSYVGLYEIREQYDVNGNGSYSNAEVKAAIDSMTGYQLTAAQKAVLWQLMTGSSSARNNPYSTQVGQQVIDARKAQKEGQ